MRRITLVLFTVATLAGLVGYTATASLPGVQEAAPIFVTKIPKGYRDWQFISVADEEGNLNSFASVLGNDVEIRAYRDGQLPFPDGAIVAALHYRFVASAENNQAFGRDQSFVAGTPTNVQFMIKDAKSHSSPQSSLSLPFFKKNQPCPRLRLSDKRDARLPLPRLW